MSDENNDEEIIYIINQITPSELLYLKELQKDSWKETSQRSRFTK